MTIATIAKKSTGMIAEEIGGIDVNETETRLERANTTLLWSERQP